MHLRVFDEFPNEIFKDIKGFEDEYAVSTNGIVVSLHRLIWNGRVYGLNKLRRLRGNIIQKGYVQVELKKDKKRIPKLVHRLVAETFIENPFNYPQINHRDGNKQNNVLGNLEWCTNSQNQKHAWATGLQKPHAAGKKMRKVRLFNDAKSYEFESVADAVRYLGLGCNANLQKVLHHTKHYNTIKGYKAEYV